MALTLFIVFQAFLLFANSVTILHEQRFLDKGMSSMHATRSFSRYRRLYSSVVTCR